MCEQCHYLTKLRRLNGVKLTKMNQKILSNPSIVSLTLTRSGMSLARFFHRLDCCECRQNLGTSAAPALLAARTFQGAPLLDPNPSLTSDGPKNTQYDEIFGKEH